MQIRIAKNSGFCFGVKRAIKIAMNTSEKYPELVTLGPIIHNPQMVKKLEEKGIKSCDNYPSDQKIPVIIRSHGIQKNVLNSLKNDKFKVIDATCPFVAKAQDLAHFLSSEGYPVLILGDENHPEVIALKSYVDGKVQVVTDYRSLTQQRFKRVGVISQTTQSKAKLNDLVSFLLDISQEVRVYNTICHATAVRQESTLALAKDSDIMIVIGGKNSANTEQLSKICQKYIPTHHIESADEINQTWFKNVKNVGITAGASTPDWIIVEVYNRINKFIGDIQENVNNVEDIPGYKEV